MIRSGSTFSIVKVPVHVIVPMFSEIGFKIQDADHLCRLIKLLTDDINTETAPVHVAPPINGYYMLQDGNHRIVANYVAGRSDVWALVTYPPGDSNGT